MALRFDRWGITLTQLSLSSDEGCRDLALPDTWLRVQTILPFASFSNKQMAFPPFVTVIFRRWARKYGVVWRPRAIPFLQLEPVPYATMGFLAPSPKHFHRPGDMSSTAC